MSHKFLNSNPVLHILTSSCDTGTLTRWNCPVAVWVCHRLASALKACSSPTAARPTTCSSLTPCPLQLLVSFPHDASCCQIPVFEPGYVSVNPCDAGMLAAVAIFVAAIMCWSALCNMIRECVKSLSLFKVSIYLIIKWYLIHPKFCCDGNGSDVQISFR